MKLMGALLFVCLCHGVGTRQESQNIFHQFCVLFVSESVDSTNYSFWLR